MIEDGDFPYGLKKLGKNVIAVDLNPLSRTSRDSDITIVDNLVRVFPTLDRYMEEFKRSDLESLKTILENYDNKYILHEVLKYIVRRISSPEVLSD